MEEQQFDGLIEKFLESASSSIITKGVVEMTNGLIASERFEFGSDAITFGIERFGYHDGLEAFRIVAFVEGGLKDSLRSKALPSDISLNDAWKVCSKGFLTEDGKHHVKFSVSRDIPRGFATEHGILLEMKDILARIKNHCKMYDITSALVDALLSIISRKKYAMPVVQDESSDTIKGESIAKLETAGDSSKKNNSMKEKEEPNALEDTIGETFAKNIGDKTYKPDKDNEIDMALKDTDEYVIKKNSFLGKLVSIAKSTFGEERDIKKLEKIFEDDFEQKMHEEITPKPNKVFVKVKRLVPNAKMPLRAHPEDKGADLFAVSKKTIVYGEHRDVLQYGYGIAIELPVGYSALIMPRSSVYKTGMMMCNSIGLIDSGYRGELMSNFYSDGESKPYEVSSDKPIAQLVIPECLATEVEFVEVDELSETERGTGGFGSTDAKR